MAVFFLSAATLSVVAGCSKTEPPTQKIEPSATTELVPKVSPQDERLATIKKLEALAGQSDAEAQVALAKLLLDGTDSKPDYARAKVLFEQAAAKGLPEATLGLVLLKRAKVLPDDQLPSIEELRGKALATKDAFVTTFLSPSFPDEPSKAVVELAQNEYPLAMARVLEHLGFCIASNARDKVIGSKTMDFCRGVERDKGALQNSVAIGKALLQKSEIDADKQRYWGALRRRLNTYRPSADYPLNALQFDHVLRKRDPYFAELAPALSKVGTNLKSGFGVQASPAKAIEFLKRAAELGDADAQLALGELYLAGRGVQKDFELSARYFAQSAQQGDAEGARALGLSYLEGRGVPKDSAKAYFWLSVASMGMNSQLLIDHAAGVQNQLGGSAGLRDKIGSAMSQEDVAKAQRLVRDWRPSYQTGEPPVLDSAPPASVGAPDTKQSLKVVATGTGFWVSKTGYGITNHHVIDGCAEVRIQGREGMVPVITSDKVNDLALLQVPGGISSAAVIAAEPSKLRQGEDIVAYGFPLNSLLSSGGNLTPGVVSATTGLGNNSNQIQITAPIQPGSSGSPVMNKKAEVVAVVSMKLSDTKMTQATGSVGQNVNFAVSGQTLRAFLDANKVEYKSGGVFSLEKNTADIAEEAKKWTTVVECWK